MLLAIDTATRSASIALYNSNGILAETTWQSRLNHTVELTAQIVKLLELAHVQKKDLQAIGVALGPGSFTGLRVGMSVAKGLAYGAHIPILGVPTLDTIAFAHAAQASPMLAILFAGRGRFSVARYLPRDGGVERVSDYALVNSDGVLELLRAEPMLVCGDIDVALAQKIGDEFGTRVVITSPAMNARRAGFLAELAWRRFQRGESDAVDSLVPMYMPHESVEGSH